MLWNREEYIAHMTHQDIGIEMFCELFGMMVHVDEEWMLQRATSRELDLSAFGWDYVPHIWVGNNGAMSGKQVIILEDNAEYTLSIDTLGRRQKTIKSSATLPLPLEYPVKDFDDWLKIKHWYEFNEERVNMEELQRLKALQEKGWMILFPMPGGFDEPRQLMGEEELCVAFYEQPELINDILGTIGDMLLKTAERVSSVLTIDSLTVHEDLAGKSGPLAGPRQVAEYIAPYYRKIWDVLSTNGTRLFSQDSDGNITPVINSFLDAGVNVFYPFEPGSGMDMVEIKKKYGKAFAVKGGINKYTLREGKQAIRQELEYKINNLTKGGGTVFALDHRIPNGTPLRNYWYYVNLGREMLDLPPASESEFVSMAF